MSKAPHASTDQEREVRLEDGPEGSLTLANHAGGLIDLQQSRWRCRI